MERTERVERAAGASGNGAIARTTTASARLAPAKRRASASGVPPGPRQRRGEPGLGKQAQTRLGAVEPGERGEAAEAAEQAHEHTQEHAGLEEYGRALPESSEQALESEERRGGGPGQEQPEADERGTRAEAEPGGREHRRGHQGGERQHPHDAKQGRHPRCSQLTRPDGKRADPLGGAVRLEQWSQLAQERHRRQGEGDGERHERVAERAALPADQGAEQPRHHHLHRERSDGRPLPEDLARELGADHGCDAAG